MKKALAVSVLFIVFLMIFMSQAFYPAPELNEQQLLSKVNLFNLRFPQEKIYLQLDRPSYWVNEDLWFKAYLINSPITDCNLSVELLNSSGILIQKKLYWAQQGLAYGDFHLTDTLSSGVYQIRAYTDWSRNFDDCWFFRQNIVIWNLRDKVNPSNSEALKQKDVDLQFFPEGGTYVTGNAARMAFKITDQHGMGLDVDGIIYDDQGNKVTDLKSQFKGMGSFLIQPMEGRKYSADITVAGKLKMKVDLPFPIAEGVTLSIDPNDKDSIHILVTDKFLLSKDKPSSEYLLIGQTNGVVFYRKEFTTEKGTSAIGLGKNKLHTGISQFTLFNKDLVPCCERLVFINHHDFVTIQIEPGKASYRTREKVQLGVKTITDAGIPCLSNLSMTVYNPDTELKTEDYPNNILTQFLLGSELKGTIEEPALYFKDDSLTTLLSLDNLMLTHGYRHFEWEQIKNDKFPEISYPPLASIQVSGLVKSIVLNKPVPECKVTMMFVKSLLSVQQQTTDSLGRFLFSDLFFNDTVYISLQAINKKGRKTNSIVLDNKSTLSPKIGFLPVTYKYSKDSPVSTTSYLSELSSDLIKKKWHLSDTILLGDINVTGTKKKKADGLFRIYSNADVVFDVAKHDDVYGNIFDMLDGRLAGVTYDADNKIFSIRNGTAAILYLNSAPANAEEISSMPTSSFDKIEVLKYAPMTSCATCGAIFFYTKRGAKFENVSTDDLGMKSAMITGYSLIRKFYSPQYEVQSVPSDKKDFRSTLYWNPIVRTDATGVANVAFYNSDQTGEVQIVVEGITSDGKLCRGLCKYNVPK